MAMTLDSGPQWAELTREFAALAGIRLEQTQRNSFSLADVFHVVLGRGLVLLGDLREPPRTEYAVDEVAFDPSPADGSRIPVRLFRLKNGAAADRHRYAEIQGLFRQLTGRCFDIALAGPPPGQGGEPAATLQQPPATASKYLPAVLELAEMAALPTGCRVPDVGAGPGGPALLLAAATSCTRSFPPRSWAMPLLPVPS
jgi:hypothetical protein